MYIEKIFIVVWHGLIALLCANVINLLRFIYLLSPKNRESFLNDMMMPARDYIFPELDKDFKWQGKFRHHNHNVENKFKHLQNVKNHGNSAEIAVAFDQYLETKENLMKANKLLW
uniref:Uncharacterized protein n=1 Tax=Panagrolaimus superbus TaxID=310955 RepID=A0A914YMQ1_9BILA